MAGHPASREAAAFPHWHAHVDVWVILGLVVVVYWRAVRAEQARRAVEEPTASRSAGREPVLSRGRLACFAGAMATLLVASDWPVHDLAEGYLYSVHMFQHLLLTMVAALLLVGATPAWMARRILGRGRLLATVRALTRLVPALVIYNLVLVLSHWPVVVEATVKVHPLHFVAHAVLLGSAVLLWLPVLSPLEEVPRLRPPVQMLYLFLQTIVPTVPASFLTFGTHPLYAIYATFPRLWGISVITDQQVAGLLMKLVGGFYLWGVITVVFFRWFASEEAAGEDARSPSESDRAGDDDTLYWDEVEKELNRTR